MDDTNKTVVETKQELTPASRKELRDKLLGKRHKPKAKTIELFGVELEIRQPSFKDIMAARDQEDPARRAADMIIKYGYVPGTDEKLFEDADVDTILQWPFGEDLMRLQETITNLTGIDIGSAEKELKADPLSGSS